MNRKSTMNPPSIPIARAWRRAHLASAANVGQASRLLGQAKRGLGGVNAAPFGAAGQTGRLPYVPGATSRVVVLARCAPWRPACALLLAWLLTGCHTTGLSSRESSPGSYSRLVYEMARNQPNATPAPRLRKPIRLAVAQLGEVSPGTNMLGELRSHPALIATVVALPAPVEYRDRYDTRTRDTPEPPATANRLAEIRSLARAMGADQVLIFGGSLDTWTTRNAFAALDITLVGAAIFPSARVHGQGKAAGILLDVESGTVRFQVETESRSHGTVPSGFASEKTDSVRVTLRDDLAAGLGREFVDRLRAE
jgi:hypothetical protein